MSSLSFPDVNVWLALATPEHVHAAKAQKWWDSEQGVIAFSRLSQMGLLRLMTTSAAMGGKPLTMTEAWSVHDGFYEDERVTFIQEPPETEPLFRALTSGRTVSPQVWADAWLLAVAAATKGTLVTFDSAPAPRGAYLLPPA
jgi:toxin-antitoxin system PIN domain toxin